MAAGDDSTSGTIDVPAASGAPNRAASASAPGEVPARKSAAQDVRDEGGFEDSRDSRTRRIFAQEFVTQLKRLGAGTAEDLVQNGIAFFSAEARSKDIEQVGHWAARYGWAEQKNDGTWCVTDAGEALPRPPSLGFGQVLTRILRVANPVRTNATDWLPLLALVAGAVAGTATIHNFDAADAVRALSVAVLVVSVAIQFYGEYRIICAFRKWRHRQYPQTRVPGSPKKARNDFYSHPRLFLGALFDLLLIGSFGLLIYWRALPVPTFKLLFIKVEPWWATVGILALALAIVVGLLESIWRRPRKQYVKALGLDTTIASRHARDSAAKTEWS